MISYATVDELEAFFEDGLPEGYDNDYFERVLELASQDIDRYSTAIVGLGQQLKFAEVDDPIEWWEDLEASQSAWIVEATCAQAEWRLAKGDQYFVEIPASLGPKTRAALKRTGLALVAPFATAR
jgi:hypothetical protein